MRDVLHDKHTNKQNKTWPYQAPRILYLLYRYLGRYATLLTGEVLRDTKKGCVTTQKIDLAIPYTMHSQATLLLPCWNTTLSPRTLLTRKKCCVTNQRHQDRALHNLGCNATLLFRHASHDDRITTAKLTYHMPCILIHFRIVLSDGIQLIFITHLLVPHLRLPCQKVRFE